MSKSLFVPIKHVIRHWVHRLRDTIRVFRDEFYGLNVYQKLETHFNDGGLTSAVAFLKKNYRFHKSRHVKLLIGLYGYIDNNQIKQLELSEGKKNLIIHIACWGEQFQNKCTTFFLPSLLAEGNLPWLAQFFKVNIVFHCDHRFKKELNNHVIHSVLEKYATFHYIVIPDKIFGMYSCANQNSESSLLFGKLNKRLNAYSTHLRYYVLGACQTHAFDFSLKNKCYISFQYPDVILSENFYKTIVSKLGNRIIGLATNLSVDVGEAHNFIKKRVSKHQLSVSSRILSEFIINHLHLSSKQRIVSDETVDFNPTAQSIFKLHSGYIIRSCHYQPFLINCGAIEHKIHLSYNTIDGNFSNHLIDLSKPIEDQVWVCTHSEEMVACELSEPSDRCIYKGKRRSLPQIENILGQWLTSHCLLKEKSLQSYLFSQRCYLGLNSLENEEDEYDIKFCDALLNRTE